MAFYTTQDLPCLVVQRRININDTNTTATTLQELYQLSGTTFKNVYLDNVATCECLTSSGDTGLGLFTRNNPPTIEDIKTYSSDFNPLVTDVVSETTNNIDEKGYEFNNYSLDSGQVNHAITLGYVNEGGGFGATVTWGSMGASSMFDEVTSNIIFFYDFWITPYKVYTVAINKHSDGYYIRTFGGSEYKWTNEFTATGLLNDKLETINNTTYNLSSFDFDYDPIDLGYYTFNYEYNVADFGVVLSVMDEKVALTLNMKYESNSEGYNIEQYKYQHFWQSNSYRDDTLLSGGTEENDIYIDGILKKYYAIDNGEKNEQDKTVTYNAFINRYKVPKSVFTNNLYRSNVYFTPMNLVYGLNYNPISLSTVINNAVEKVTLKTMDEPYSDYVEINSNLTDELINKHPFKLYYKALDFGDTYKHSSYDGFDIIGGGCGYGKYTSIHTVKANNKLSSALQEGRESTQIFQKFRQEIENDKDNITTLKIFNDDYIYVYDILLSTKVRFPILMFYTDLTLMNNEDITNYIDVFNNSFYRQESFSPICGCQALPNRLSDYNNVLDNNVFYFDDGALLYSTNNSGNYCTTSSYTNCSGLLSYSTYNNGVIVPSFEILKDYWKIFLIQYSTYLSTGAKQKTYDAVNLFNHIKNFSSENSTTPIVNQTYTTSFFYETSNGESQTILDENGNKINKPIEENQNADSGSGENRSEEDKGTHVTTITPFEESKRLTVNTAKCGLLSSWVVNEQNISNLGTDLFDTNIFNQIKNGLTRPIDAILKLAISRVKPKQAMNTKNIKLGIATSSAVGNKITNNLLYVDMGWLYFERINGDLTDYSEQIFIHLPFIKDIQLDPKHVIKRWLHLQYKFDFLTGNCVAYLISNTKQSDTFDEKSIFIGQWCGNFLTTIPIGSMSNDTLLTSLASVTLGTTHVLSRGYARNGINQGLSNKIGSINESIQPSMTHVSELGSNNAEFETGLQAYVTRYICCHNGSENMYQIEGNSTSKVNTLSRMNGFTKVINPRIHINGLTDTENDMIDNLLQSGVNVY